MPPRIDVYSSLTRSSPKTSNYDSFHRAVAHAQLRAGFSGRGKLPGVSVTSPFWVAQCFHLSRVGCATFFIASVSIPQYVK